MIKLNEIYELRKAEGVVKDKTELGLKLWPDSSRESMLINTAKLFNGRTKRIEFDWVGIICEWLQCEPNDLFENYQDKL
jgi:hypothetical protein